MMKLGLSVGVLIGIAPALLLIWPVDGEPVAVIGRQDDALPAIAAANGQIMGGLGRLGGMVARSDEKGFVGRLYGAGATLVVRVPRGSACGVTGVGRIGL